MTTPNRADLASSCRKVRESVESPTHVSSGPASDEDGHRDELLFRNELDKAMVIGAQLQSTIRLPLVSIS
jgi:hypothetical protein